MGSDHSDNSHNNSSQLQMVEMIRGFKECCKILKCQKLYSIDSNVHTIGKVKRNQAVLAKDNSRRLFNKKLRRKVLMR